MIYLCSNLFGQADRSFNIEIASKLRKKGWSVFVPQEQPYNNKKRRDIEISSMSIFKNDVEAINKSNSMFIILDGQDIGSGICFECGIFWCLHNLNPKKHWGVVGLWTEIRQHGVCSNIAYRSQQMHLNQFCVGGIEDMGTICSDVPTSIQEMEKIQKMRDLYCKSLTRKTNINLNISNTI